MQGKPLIIGNWKMELSYKGSLELVRALKKLLKDIEVSSDIVVCPSYPALAEAAAALKTFPKLELGAQNVDSEEKGAKTGSVAVGQITPFVKWCIVGHSEVREALGETDEEVLQKANLLLKHGLTPIVCIGESLAERQADQTVAKITAQIEKLFSGLTRVALAKLVIAYEPIWAISAEGSGILPEPAEAAEAILLIRKLAANRFGNEAAQRLRLLYGGSVSPNNVGQYVGEPGVDGVLVGSASVEAVKFVEIVKIIQAAAQ